MTYDLYILPADGPMSTREAAAVVDRGSVGFLFGHDKRLDPFIAAMERRYGRLRGLTAAPPFEFDVARSFVFVGMPWSAVEELVTGVAAIAYESGLAVWDPQRDVVGLPAPHGEGPLTAEGTEPHVAQVDRAFAAISRGADRGALGDEEEVREAVSEELRAGGFRTFGPSPFDAALEVDDEASGASGTDAPGAAVMQVPERRDALLGILAGDRVGERHQALVQLAEWGPDPAVAAALRPLLASDDVFEATQAAAGIARQQDITDLPAMLDLVHRLSPDDGGTPTTMLPVLRSALQLAALAGPPIVEGLKARASTWRTPAGGRRPTWGKELDEELDVLLRPAADD